MIDKNEWEPKLNKSISYLNKIISLAIIYPLKSHSFIHSCNQALVQPESGQSGLNQHDIFGFMDLSAYFPRWKKKKKNHRKQVCLSTHRGFPANTSLLQSPRIKLKMKWVPRLPCNCTALMLNPLSIHSNEAVIATSVNPLKSRQPSVTHLLIGTNR